jgi:hypothetical protein
MDNNTVILLAEQGDNQACLERLRREIMAIENIHWPEAALIADEIKKENQSSGWLMTVPHKIGVTVAITAGIGCIPFIFHKASVTLFNEKFVTAEVPDAETIQTFLEVGSWSWGWMEPVLGTASFTLLAMQFARNQMLNMSISPYTDSVREMRAKRLAKIYSKYDEDILKDFSRTAPFSTMASSR